MARSYVPIRTLRLCLDQPAEGARWPILTVLVDGVDLLARAAPGWGGFGPAQMLTDPSPLLPTFPPRRVALYRCSCGEAFCGVIAPLIWTNADLVRWSDFRDFVGVFDGPTVDADPDGGTRWRGIGAVSFDRDQYVAEVERAVAALRTAPGLRRI